MSADTCPKCNYVNTSTSIFCEHCGFRLIEGPIICPKCQFENASAASFCSKCGTMLGTGENNVKDTKKEIKIHNKFFQPFIEVNKIIKIFFLLWLLVNSFLLVYSYMIDPNSMSCQRTIIRTYYSEYDHKQLLDLINSNKRSISDTKTWEFFPFPYVWGGYVGYPDGVTIIEDTVDISQYDYTEFRVYIILPVLLYLVFYYINPKRQSKPEKGRIFLPIAAILLMLFVVFIFWGSPYLKNAKIVEKFKSEVVNSR